VVRSLLLSGIKTEERKEEEEPPQSAQRRKTVADDEEEVKIASPPKKRQRKKKDGETSKPERKSQFHTKSSFRGVPFNRQFGTAIYLLFLYFSEEKFLQGPKKSFDKARCVPEYFKPIFLPFCYSLGVLESRGAPTLYVTSQPADQTVRNHVRKKQRY